MDQPLTLERIIKFLLETPLFEDLDPAELSEIVHITQVQRIRDGQIIFREGDPGDAWYVLFEGNADVLKESEFGPQQPFASLEPRSCFGEMAILDDSPRSATVVARGDGRVLRFPRDPFDLLLESGSLAAYKLVYQMARVLAQRQRNLTQRLSDAMDEEPSERPDLRRRIGHLVDKYKVSE